MRGTTNEHVQYVQRERLLGLFLTFKTSWSTRPLEPKYHKNQNRSEQEQSHHLKQNPGNMKPVCRETSAAAATLEKSPSVRGKWCIHPDLQCAGGPGAEDLTAPLTGSSCTSCLVGEGKNPKSSSGFCSGPPPVPAVLDLCE